MRTTAKLTKSGGPNLLPHGINLMRVKDANAAEYSEVTSSFDFLIFQATVNALGFHPNAQLFFTASFDGRLRLFQVFSSYWKILKQKIDGVNNPKVQSIYFQGYAINGANFTPDGNEILLHSGRTNMLHLYDVRTSEVQKITRPQPGKKGFSASCISPDNQYIALFSSTGVTLLSGMQL